MLGTYVALSRAGSSIDRPPRVPGPRPVRDAGASFAGHRKPGAPFGILLVVKNRSASISFFGSSAL